MEVLLRSVRRWPSAVAQWSRGLGRWLRALDLADALCLVLLAILAAAGFWAVLHKGFDYDEVEHAYAANLIRKGMRPVADFYEPHPPLPWYLLSLAPLILGDDHQRVLVAYRLLTIAGHILFFAGLAKNVSLSFARLEPPRALTFRTFALALAVIVPSERWIMEYLSEIRPDSWPNALLVWGIYRYRRGSPRVVRAAAELGFMVGMAVLCSPKLFVFPSLFVAATLAVETERLRRLAGLALGSVMALAAMALAVLAAGLPLVNVGIFSYVFHHILNKKAGFDHALFLILRSYPVTTAIAVVGVCGWIAVVRKRIYRSPFELSVVGYLVVQAIIVSFGYKQYVAPWYLLGALTFLPYLDLALSRIKPLHAIAAAVAVVYSLVGSLDAYRVFEQSKDASNEIAFKTWAQARIPAKGFVVAPLTVTPLFRRPVFYHYVTSMAPSGWNEILIVPTLGIDSISRRFTPQAYAAELESKRPHVIILEPGDLPGHQRKAVDEYLARHPGWYRKEGGGPQGQSLYVRTIY